MKSTELFCWGVVIGKLVLLWNLLLSFKTRRQHDCGSLLWTDLTYGSTSGVREGGQEAESHEVSFVLELRVLVGFVAGGGPAGGTGCSWKGGEQAR